MITVPEEIWRQMTPAQKWDYAKAFDQSKLQSAAGVAEIDRQISALTALKEKLKG
jgi:hypothetical protein